METSNIRLFSFYPPEGERPENYKNEVIDRLGQFILAAKGSGVNLCHENEKGIYGDIPERCLEIHKALPELKGIFDPANFVQCGVDTLGAWDMLKDYIYYMHIKDAREDGFVVPAGYGAGNLKEVVSAFIKNGGRNFTIEPHLTVFDGLGALEREGEKSGIGEFKYASAELAFDDAATKFKDLLGGIR
jgi:sugar phosphate isomerase/epimerase